MTFPSIACRRVPARSPFKRFLAALLCASVLTQGLFGNAPYVVAGSQGNEVWQIEGGVASKQPAGADGHVTVSSVGPRPAFTAPIRPAADLAPGEVVWPVGNPVFVIADTHGEFEIVTEFLIKQGVISSELAWAFGRGHLVITGDVFDRGPHQTELLWLFYKLEAEAAAAGGALHLILGNHEAMVLTGDLRYLNPKYPEEARAFGVARYSDLWAKDSLLGQWLRTKPTVFKLGGTLCLHGGISVGTVDQRFSLREVNQTVRDWLNDGASKDSGRLAWIKGGNGPLWYRGLVRKDAKPEDVEAIKKFYGVERIAVGHTIVPTVTSLYNGSVIAVQVYPTKDKATGKMNMEGVYIDGHGVWHKAKMDGTREALRDDTGDPIRNDIPASSFDAERDKARK